MDTVIFVIATVVAILTSVYLFAQSQVDYLKKHWVEYRCNPMYMPVAGLVGDDVVSNFTKCTMKGFHDYAGFIMDPIMAEFSIINDTISSIGDAMNSFRSMFSSVRGGMLGIVGTVFGKIHNVMSQTQYTIIRMRTIMSRIVAVMYSFVYVFYSGMQTGQSTVNGPVGKTVSFICFDENTIVETFEGTKPIKDVKIGDRMTGDLALVTSIYNLDGKGVQMYSLSDILVTGSHKVKHKGKFIRVDKHPSAKKVSKESKNLVCLNTTNHHITIKNYCFLDFVESDDSTFVDFKNQYIGSLYNTKTAVERLSQHTGLLHGTRIPLMYNEVKQIQDIKVGDVLDNGETVKGICKHSLIDELYVEIDKGILSSPSTWIYKNNSIIRANQFGHAQYDQNNDLKHVYQLITETSMFPVLSQNDNRIMIIDELQTTDSHYHAIKDSIITSGRFRSKLIVV